MGAATLSDALRAVGCDLGQGRLADNDNHGNQDTATTAAAALVARVAAAVGADLPLARRACALS